MYWGMGEGKGLLSPLCLLLGEMEALRDGGKSVNMALAMRIQHFWTSEVEKRSLSRTVEEAGTESEDIGSSRQAFYKSNLLTSLAGARVKKRRLERSGI